MAKTMARVKADSRWARIQAFSGHEYVKEEWREVPEGSEKEARDNEYLEVKGSEAPKPKAAEAKKAE